MLGFAILFPVGYAIAIQAVLFDGMRHFIFVLPPIACAAALVADRALDRLRALAVAAPAYGALALYGACHVGVMAMLHPDEYVYYNVFVGGVHGARKACSSSTTGPIPTPRRCRGSRIISRRIRRRLHGSRLHRRGVRSAGLGRRIISRATSSSRRTATTAQFFIAFTKDNCDKALPGKVIYRVERMGTLLSLVLDRREILARTPPPRSAGR